jgi:peptidylprolyl isomerase
MSSPSASSPSRRVGAGAAALALVLAACGGSRTRGESATATTETTAPISTTVPMPKTSLTECEDVPDPADYPAGSIPQALRPCTAPTQLTIQTIRPGVGRAAAVGDTLILDYTGVRSATGEMFDSSYLRGIPFNFVLGRGGVIAGWDQGLVGTQAGQVLKLDVPSDLGYGANPPSDDIQPGDDLTFMVEVRAVVPPVTAADAPLDLVVTPSTGAKTLGVVDVTIGDGATVEKGDTAVLHMLLVRGDNLKVLLDTWKRSDPLQVVVAEGQSLPGLIEGIQGARVGGTRVLTLPPDLAFGPDGEPGLGLPAGQDLIVVAEVFGVY